MPTDEKLILLDAHALIHRAYHAIQTDLLSPKGEPTKAVYGFASTLLKVLLDYHPRYVGACFDVGKSKRVEQYAEYKATRPKMADDLAVQIGRVRELCELFGIPIYAKESYEADDLLGTLAKQASEQGIHTIIVTGDTDTFQLADANTEILTFTHRTSEMILYNVEKIKERYELTPRQLIDLKALRGDPSDNVPGVPGIGDKTATKLLTSYGSVEGILDHLDEIDKKTRDKLAANADQLRLNKQLVTIDCSVEGTKLDLKAAEFGGYDQEKTLAFFREMAFQSLTPRLIELGQSFGQEAPSAAAPQGEPVKYHTVLTKKDLTALVKKLESGKGFAFDTETTSLDELNADLVGLSIGVGNHEAYYIPVGHGAPPAPPPPPAGKKKAREAQASFFDNQVETIPVKGQEAPPPDQLDLKYVIEKLRPVFADPKIPKFAHNARYDLIVLAEHGLETRGLAFDTMIAAQLLEPSASKVGLKQLVSTKFGHEMTEIEGLIGKGKNQLSMSQVSIEQASTYACADGDYTYRLYELYRDQIKERGLEHLFYDLEMPLVPVIVELERAGVLLDTAALERLSAMLAARMGELEAEIYEQVGAPFNISSPQQLSDALFVKLGLSTKGLERTRTGQISTAAGVLEGLRESHPVIPLILEHRELSKLKGTYVDALPQLISPKDGRVHTSYSQNGAVTGRISSSNPNLQNIPVKTELGRQVRKAFIAPEGHLLLSADYSQVELRILAHVSHDENLLQAFADGEDVHASTASRLFGIPVNEVTKEQRRLGKTMNFGIVYGISDWGVAGRTDLSIEASRDLINKYWEKYPKVREYMERTKEQARTQGYVESLMGRRRYFPELQPGSHIPVGMRNQQEREAINMPIQATAADIIKQAMVNLSAELAERKLTSRMILQVHDELVLECPEDEIQEVGRIICDVMENAYQLDAPLQVDVAVGPNWDGMEAIQA